MHNMSSMKNDDEPLRQGLGPVHHPVSTKNALAQKYFDQGLAQYYSFNHHTSARSFRQAYKLDPKLAIAHWGVALAVGPNINSDITPDREKEAFEEITKAQALAPASGEERDLIEALAARYSGDASPDYSKLAQSYRSKMGDLAAKYPGDNDVATLYAESIMDLHPWHLWTADGKPIEGTEECVAVLKKVLEKDKNHIGANHFLIHAVEGSQHPEEAKLAANRLDVLAPGSGHLVHMPSHIYIRTGDYHEGMVANQKAIKVDAAYLEKTPNPGMYPMYYIHNFDMLRHAASMAGNYKESQWAAVQLVEKGGHMEGMPLPVGMSQGPVLNDVRFRRWQDVLAAKEPKGDSACSAAWHFARGMAQAATGHTALAEDELKSMKAEEDKTGSDANWGMTPAKQSLLVAEHVLTGKIAGSKGDLPTEVAEYTKAVELEDQIGYDEPPDFFFPVRESLGGALLRSGKAAEAEKVFREDLRMNPKNPRSLFGLAESLKKQGKSDKDALADFKTAWKWADVRLAVEDL